jgi:hypothetical protein
MIGGLVRLTRKNIVKQLFVLDKMMSDQDRRTGLIKGGEIDMTTIQIEEAIKDLKVKAMKRKDRKAIKIYDKVLALFCAGEKVVKVPVEYKRGFKVEAGHSLRDLAGRSVGR